jgi:4-amino-4-deoxy-L-arabinose transferase-like glycosyltransferase
LLNTLEFLSRAFIWVVIYLLPVLLVIFVLFVLPIIILVRFWRRRRARNRAEAVTVPGEKPTDQA